MVTQATIQVCQPQDGVEHHTLTQMQQIAHVFVSV